MEQSQYKKLMINPTILVLISEMDHEAITKVEERVKEIRSILPSVPWYIVHVASALGTQSFEQSESCQGVQQINALHMLLDSFRTLTSRREILRILREKTCIQVAEALSITKVLLPENGDYLGRLTLAQMCLGRGPAVSELTAVVDKRANKVWFVRPLRDISIKELTIVNHLKNYEKDVIILTKDAKLPIERSIQAATSRFVDNLFSEGYKSTITTVLSTAGKLHLLTPQKICGLCYINGAENSSSLCPTCQNLTKEVSDVSLLNPLLLL